MVNNIKQYLDATYLKTAKQAKVSKKEHLAIIDRNIHEAIGENFKLIMLRPAFVNHADMMIKAAKFKVLVGTVIDFPKGKGGLETKLMNAKQAISDGADELDFVINYKFDECNVFIKLISILINVFQIVLYS